MSTVACRGPWVVGLHPFVNNAYAISSPSAGPLLSKDTLLLFLMVLLKLSLGLGLCAS